jgi:hypothetical protein
MPFPVHPHMLRHGCGYALANAGHDTRALQAYLGHKNIQHTVRNRVGTGSVQGFLAIALVAASRPASAAFRRAAAELHYMVSPLVEPVEGLRALPYGAPINRDHAREHERKSKFCFEVGDKTRNPPRRGQPMK